MSLSSQEPQATFAFLPAGDRALLVHFGEEISESVRVRIQSLSDQLKGATGLHLTSVQPAYSSVLLKFDPLRVDHDRLRSEVENLLRAPVTTLLDGLRETAIPVCYNDLCAPDLAFVSKHTGLSKKRLIDAHSGARYRVSFLGFMPGFAYLSGLPERLTAPRLSSPRLKVPAGSVGIGDRQTGVYPLESPGGWQLIGRTPVHLFDPVRSSPVLLQAGDRVRFQPISLAEFERLGGKC